MLFFKTLLIAVLVFVFVYPTAIYAADNSTKYISETKSLYFYVIPNQDTEINLEEKVGKINSSSYFDVIDLPKNGDIKWKDHIHGIFIYSNNFENTTENIVITETAGDQVKKFNITLETGIKPLVTPHDKRIMFGALFAIIIGIIITFVMRYILHKTNGKFSDIIRGRDIDPSLSLFQFLVWTWVVIFSFVFIYSIKILAGDYNLAGSSIPYNLLVLMGISTVVPIASTVISKAYYDRDLTEEQKVADYWATKNDEELNEERKKNPIGNMLKENKKPTLGRYQFFAWTFIGIFLYLFSLSTYISSNDQPQEIRNISLPDVDITFVVLMGLSSSAFLGLKTVSNFMTIREVLPETVKPGDDLQIFGRNFGEQSDTVWIGNKAIKNLEKPDKLIWSNEQIDLKVPQDAEEGEQDVRVVQKGGSIKSGKKILIHKQPPPATDKDKTTTTTTTPTDKDKTTTTTTTPTDKDKTTTTTHTA